MQHENCDSLTDILGLLGILEISASNIIFVNIISG
jgi:hypothetical protein